MFLRLDVEVLLGKLDFQSARGLAADLSGQIYMGEESADRYWYKSKTEAEIKDWLRTVLNQDQMPDMAWVETLISEAMWGPLE